MATIQRITYKVKINRELPVVKIVTLKGDKGDPGEGTGEMNVIEVIKVNGTTQTVTNKTVNLSVPTDTGDLSNGGGYLNSTNISGGVTSGNTGLVNGGQVYAAIQTATDTTSGVGSGNTNLVNGGQVYTAIQNAISAITDGDAEEY